MLCQSDLVVTWRALAPSGLDQAARLISCFILPKPGDFRQTSDCRLQTSDSRLQAAELVLGKQSDNVFADFSCRLAAQEVILSSLTILV
jgi:hypothetical protein